MTSGFRIFQQRKGFLQTVVALVETGNAKMEQTGFLRLSLSLQLMGHLVDLCRMLAVVVKHITEKDDGPLSGRCIAVGVIMISVIPEMFMGMDMLMGVDVRMFVSVGRAVRVRMGMGMFVGVLVTVATGALVLVFFVH